MDVGKITKYVIALALAMIVFFYAFSAMQFAMTPTPGYPIGIWGWLYNQYSDGTSQSPNGNLIANTYASVSSTQLVFATDLTSYANVSTWAWNFLWHIGDTYVSLALGTNGKYGINVNHGDINLLKPTDSLWSYESSYMNDTNPRIVYIKNVVSNVTLPDGTIRVTYNQTMWKIYRMWTTVNLEIYGSTLDGQISGYTDPSAIKTAVGVALNGINNVSMLHPVSGVSDPGGTRNSAVALRLSISPMAISSGEDWYGFLGAWVAGNGAQKAGCTDGSEATLSYENPHTVITMYKNQGNPLTLPYYTSPGTEEAYNHFSTYPYMTNYTLSDLESIPQSVLSTEVVIPIQILSMGVQYASKTGSGTDIHNYITSGSEPSVILPIVFDLMTNSNSTWYEDYTPPSPPTEQAKISGYVKDSTSGEYLGGVNVELTDISGYVSETDAYGYFSMTNVPEGTHEMKFSKYGYNDAYHTVTCVTGLETHVNATLNSVLWGWATMHQIQIGLIVFLFLCVLVAVYEMVVKPKSSYRGKRKWL
jgi:hypothetical protein